MNKNFLKTRKWKEKYVWDSGALVQNSPDGPKCQGRAHTVTERFLGATARGAFLETAPSSYVAMSGQDEPFLWHPRPRQSPKIIWQRKIHIMIGKLKESYSTLLFKRSFGWDRKSPAHLPPQRPCSSSSTRINLAEGQTESNQKQPQRKEGMKAPRNVMRTYLGISKRSPAWGT